jgi:hypothetical protein
MAEKTTEFDLIETALLRYQDESGIVLKDTFKTEEEIGRFGFGKDNKNVLNAAPNDELFHFKVIAEAIKYFQMGSHPRQDTNEDINLTQIAQNIDEVYSKRNSLDHDGYSLNDQESNGIKYSAYDVPLRAMDSIELRLTISDMMMTGNLPITMESEVQTVNISKVLAAKGAIEIAKENQDLWNVSAEAKTALIESIYSFGELSKADTDTLIKKASTMIDSKIQGRSNELKGISVKTTGNSIDLLFLDKISLFGDAITEIDAPVGEQKEELMRYGRGEHAVPKAPAKKKPKNTSKTR